MTSYTKNIVTDYAVPTDGTSDCSVKWLDFTTFLAGLSAGDSVALTIPNAGAGGANVYAFHRAGGGINLFPGIIGGLTITVAMTGVQLTDGGGGSGFFLVSLGLRQDNTHSSRIASVNAGATSVTLSTPSEHSRFSVGQYIAVTGFDLQNDGVPPNPAFFEYRKITSKNTGAGTLFFTEPLRNQYLSTWPLYTAGSGASLDEGGPATVYAMPPEWDVDLTINAGVGAISLVNGLTTYCNGRRVIFNGGGCADARGVTPSIAQYMEFNDFTQSACGVEVDKMNVELRYNRGSVGQLDFASMGCATNCYVTDTIVTTYNGTPRNLVHTGGTIGSLQIGATSYGRTDSVTVNNCVVSAVSSSGIVVSDVVVLGYTMSGGVIRLAFASKALNWAVPGTYLYWHGAKLNENFTCCVLSVVDDGVNTIVTTTLTGGFPNVPLQSGTKLNLGVYPCPVWHGSGNSGCADIVDLNNAGAQGWPLYAYSKRPYSGALLTSPTFKLWGQLRATNVNVSRAYTGAQSALIMEILGNGGADALTVDRTAAVSYSPLVNLKQTGTRTITPTAVSAQSGDTLGAAPGNIWFSGFQGIYANHDISGENSALWPIVEIELMTDQGIPPPITVSNINTSRHYPHHGGH